MRGANEILTEVRGRLGIITLNRAEALNALNLNMVEQLKVVLTGWGDDPRVDAILLRSASERAFCAGGDVRSIGILPIPEDRMVLGRAFFGTEYRVNLLIHNFSKPFISLINGIAMGGGLGLSVHGSYRLVSENLRMAMPETALGLFPDVGGTWFLNRCPGHIGRYLALLGSHIGAADALTAGLATHHVPQAAFEHLTLDLATAAHLDRKTIDAIIQGHAASTEGGTLASRAAKIDQLFAGDELDAVIARIDARASEADWIAEARAVLRRASPISLRITWRRMVDGHTQSIERILEDDFRVAVRMVAGHDFAEGVRAILVDKDGAPQWQPNSLEQVAEADISTLLAPLA